MKPYQSVIIIIISNAQKLGKNYPNHAFSRTPIFFIKNLTDFRKGRYTLGDKLQQHSEATRRSDKSLRVYCRILRKCLSLQQNFVAATSRTDSVWFDFLRLVAATKFRCGDKDFHKDSPVHTERFVAATCRLTVLLQLVARSVHMEWSVAATCCCNLSPSVYRP